MRFNASKSELSQSVFLAKFGEHPAAVYPRHIFEVLQPYKPIGTFIAQHFGVVRDGSAAPGASSTAPPPLVLSFQDKYKGSDELRSVLKDSFSLPAGWEAGTWSLSAGASGSGIPMHSTHDAVAAAVVWGRKHWILAPPGALEGSKSAYWASGPTHLVPSQWPKDVAPMLRNTSLGILQCTQPVGTVLYVPAWWWHGTYNEGDCLSVNAQLDSEKHSSAKQSPYEARQALADQMHDILQGRRPAEGLADFGSRAIDAVTVDPLQLLRNVETVGAWWIFFMGNSQLLAMFASQVQRIADWARQNLSSGTLMPEQCASLAFNLFPFGSLAGEQYTKLPHKHPARGAVRDLGKLFASAVAKPLFDARYRPHAGVLFAAMYLEAGREREATAALNKHVGKAALAMQLVASYAAGLSHNFRPFWQKWIVQQMGEL